MTFKHLLAASLAATSMVAPAFAAPKTQTKPVQFSDENGLHLQSDYQLMRQRLDEQAAKIAELEAGNEAVADLYDSLPNIIKRSAITGFADLVVGGASGDPVWLNKSGSKTFQVDNNVDLGTRIRLNALIPISPDNKDALRVRLNYKNILKYSDRLGFRGARQYFDGVDDLGIDKLYYQRSIGKGKGAFTIGAIETEFKNMNAGAGSYRFSEARTFKEFTAGVAGRPTDGGGIGAYYWFSPNVALSAGITSQDTTDVDGNKGINNPNRNYTAEALYKNNKDTFRAALGFTRSESQDGGQRIVDYGTTYAAAPFGKGTNATGNSIGFQTGYKLSKNFSLNANVGYTWAASDVGGKTANIPQYSLNGTLENAFGRKGDKFGITVGALPYIASASANVDANNAVPYAVEALYSFQVNKNLAVQPGVVVYANSNGFDGSPTTVAAYVKTTFNF